MVIKKFEGNAPDRFFSGSGNDAVSGAGGNDKLRGGEGNDRLFGEADNDGLFGNEDHDELFGQNGDDLLKGGDGYDRIYGGEGNDVLYGQKGLNILVGAGGNDTLISLGNAQNQDNLLADSPPLLNENKETIKIEYESMFGGQGADQFRILKNSDIEGDFFTNGQKYAVIRDFDPGEDDKIFLPGSPDDYRAEFFGAQNQGTAILYTADPGFDIGLGVGVLSLGTGVTIDVPTEAALVAIIENNTARNMYNSEFYEYTGN